MTDEPGTPHDPLQHGGADHQSAHATAHATTHNHAHLDEGDWAEMAEATEELGEVFSDFVHHAIAWVNELRDPAHGPVRHVIDVGSGPGVAACAFATAFPTARATAADSSPAMLQRAAARAERLGLSDRFETNLAELPDRMEGIDQADVVWASMALHHVGDEVAALRAMGRLLRPGGILIVAEFPENEGPMTMLPALIDNDVPGLVARIAEASRAWFGSMRAGLAGSTPSRALEEMVAAAGLEVMRSHVDRIRLEAPLSASAKRVAVRTLERVESQMGDLLGAADLAALARLRDPTNERSLLRRNDLYFDAARLVVAIRNPPGT